MSFDDGNKVPGIAFCFRRGSKMIVNLAVRRRTKQYSISMMRLRAFFSIGGGYATRQTVLSAKKKELFSESRRHLQIVGSIFFCLLGIQNSTWFQGHLYTREYGLMREERHFPLVYSLNPNRGMSELSTVRSSGIDTKFTGGSLIKSPTGRSIRCLIPSRSSSEAGPIPLRMSSLGVLRAPALKINFPFPHNCMEGLSFNFELVLRL